MDPIPGVTIDSSIKLGSGTINTNGWDGKATILYKGGGDIQTGHINVGGQSGKESTINLLIFGRSGKLEFEKDGQRIEIFGKEGEVIDIDYLGEFLELYNQMMDDLGSWYWKIIKGKEERKLYWEKKFQELRDRYQHQFINAPWSPLIGSSLENRIESDHDSSGGGYTASLPSTQHADWESQTTKPWDTPGDNFDYYESAVIAPVPFPNIGESFEPDEEEFFDDSDWGDGPEAQESMQPGSDPGPEEESGNEGGWDDLFDDDGWIELPDSLLPGPDSDGEDQSLPLAELYDDPDFGGYA
ncbi:hypothetical protein [Sedimenticola sp.]|uniref:hypothetical protein n=1 Tax=Sedimenticola sp. TaxID=1940285 RepID=UPI003D0FBD29